MKRVTRRERAAVRRACEGKVRHPDQASAAVAMRRLLARSPLTMMSFYECPSCGGWHVGHTPKGVRQSIADKRKAGTL